MINKLILTIIYLLISGCSSCDSNPPTSSIAGCTDQNANNYSSSANIDDGSCTYTGTDNHPMNSLWFVSNFDGTWGIGYNSNVNISGIQIIINGSTIISVINGDAQEYGFSVTANETTGIILGFSFSGGTIPAGLGILFSLELDGIPGEITNIIISDGSPDSVSFTFDSTP